jgi:YebC/PmpR family DNA-binding regulatory protein
MSGHSKWSTIKHKKGAADARRGQVFSKIAKELTVAAKHGGGDPSFNPRLRTVLLKAKAVNMPADNIERAIKKGTGELPGVSYEEVTYEGYGTGGVALLVDVLTDNKNRTAGEIRSIFTKHGGHLAGTNAVKHLFHFKGHIVVSKEQISEDELLETVLEAGGEDMTPQNGTFEVITDPHNFEAVHKAIEARGVKPDAAEITYLPTTPVPVADEKAAQAVLRLVEALEEHDDVQNVYSNFDIPDEVLEKASAAAA